MATVTTPSRTTQPKRPTTKPVDRDQLRRDRIVAIVTFIIVAVVMALMIWLASMSGSVNVDHFDYYYPMP